MYNFKSYGVLRDFLEISKAIKNDDLDWISKNFNLSNKSVGLIKYLTQDGSYQTIKLELCLEPDTTTFSFDDNLWLIDFFNNLFKGAKRIMFFEALLGIMMVFESELFIARLAQSKQQAEEIVEPFKQKEECIYKIRELIRKRDDNFNQEEYEELISNVGTLDLLIKQFIDTYTYEVLHIFYSLLDLMDKNGFEWIFQNCNLSNEIIKTIDYLNKDNSYKKLKKYEVFSRYGFSYLLRFNSSTKLINRVFFKEVFDDYVKHLNTLMILQAFLIIYNKHQL